VFEKYRIEMFDRKPQGYVDLDEDNINTDLKEACFAGVD
jgi:hypothetical protein